MFWSRRGNDIYLGDYKIFTGCEPEHPEFTADLFDEDVVRFLNQSHRLTILDGPLVRLHLDARELSEAGQQIFTVVVHKDGQEAKLHVTIGINSSGNLMAGIHTPKPHKDCVITRQLQFANWD